MQKNKLVIIKNEMNNTYKTKFQKSEQNETQWNQNKMKQIIFII